MSIFNKSDLAILDELMVHGFRLRSAKTFDKIETEEDFNESSENHVLVKLTYNCGSVIDELFSKGLLHLTKSNLGDVAQWV
jgi:hypothetical protein